MSAGTLGAVVLEDAHTPDGGGTAQGLDMLDLRRTLHYTAANKYLAALSIIRALEIENAELRTALDYLSGTCQQLADEANKTYADSAISWALELLSKSKGAE